MTGIRGIEVNTGRYDARDDRLIEVVEKIYGIRDMENTASGGEVLFVRRSPGLLEYAIFSGPGALLVGYLVIGENEDGRIVLQAQDTEGETCANGSDVDSATTGLGLIVKRRKMQHRSTKD